MAQSKQKKRREILKMPITVLTKKHITFIRKNYRRMSASGIDKKFGVSKGVSKRYMKKNGLNVSRAFIYKLTGKKISQVTSSNPDTDYLINELYLLLPVNTIANLIARSETFVKTRKRQLNLITPQPVVEEFKLLAQFKKGNAVFNKGMKQADYMTPEAIEKTKATRFKKGEIAPNKIHFRDGDITIRHRNDRNITPHKYIRISLGEWQELQIYNWEKINGPVPDDYVLACKDDDTLNCHPSNWYLLSMKNNMLRNSASLNLTDNYVAMCLCGKNNMHLMEDVVKDKKLIEAKRQQLILKRIINDTATNSAKTRKHEGPVLRVRKTNSRSKKLLDRQHNRKFRDKNKSQNVPAQV